MSAEMVKENFCVNQVSNKNKIITMQGDMIVPDVKPDILNIIKSNGNCYVKKREILEGGKIRIELVMNVYVVYLSDSGEIRSINSNLEHIEMIDWENIEQNMKLIENLELKSIEAKMLNERKINVRANIEWKGRIYNKTTIGIIQNYESLENVEMLQDEITVKSMIGEGSAKAIAKENVVVDVAESVAEILKCEIQIKNIENKISYNKVLSKAECDVKIVYLTDTGNINIARSTIPVMGFIDILNVDDTKKCNTEYKLKNMLVIPNSQEEHSIYVEFEYEVFCSVFESKEVKIVKDMYGTKNDIVFENKEVCLDIEQEEMIETLDINENINIPEISKLIDVTSRVQINNVVQMKDISEYQGEINLELMYETGDNNSLGSKNINLSFQMKLDGKNAREYDIQIQNEEYILDANNNIICNIRLIFKSNSYANTAVNIIDNIEVSEDEITDNYSMVIYFVKKDDTLWKIAKKMKTTVNDIIKMNELENVDKLAIGQKLYIPR